MAEDAAHEFDDIEAREVLGHVGEEQSVRRSMAFALFVALVPENEVLGRTHELAAREAFEAADAFQKVSTGALNKALRQTKERLREQRAKL